MNSSSPFALPLAPIPVSRLDKNGVPSTLIPDGFVDDEVIADLLSVPESPRLAALHSDLVLSADENDFAGWSVQRNSPFRLLAEQQEQPLTPPCEEDEITEPGLGLPHRGGHRWWIATVTGLSSALILSLLFGSLASRTGGDSFTAKLSQQFENLQFRLGSLAP